MTRFEIMVNILIGCGQGLVFWIVCTIIAMAIAIVLELANIAVRRIRRSTPERVQRWLRDQRKRNRGK